VRPFASSPRVAPTGTTLLPAMLLSRYLFFLTQRPISRSNTHYALQRIHGMQALGPLLAEGGHEQLTTSIRLLQTLDPRNIYEVAERLQLTLLPFACAELPTTYISAEAPPPPDFLRSSNRIVLVLGPAIGIGDEIVVFPLSQWIKRANPDAHVTTLTAYEGLWDGVPGVDRLLTYPDHAALVDTIRGRGEAGTADLVVFVDFEYAELYRAIAAEAEVARYVELSLGARILTAVDNRASWTYHQTLSAAYFRNVYDGFDELARRLGVAPDPADRVEPDAGRVHDGELRVFVSPFSSKYEPSARYWSTLLASLIPDGARRAVQFVLDVGPNATTQRWAAGVARAAAARTQQPTVTHTLAAVDEARRFSLPAVFAELRRADVAVCADSFVAHAAPRLGCSTLVVASPGLENWRVPSGHSYYFDADRPLGDVVSAMRQILDLHGIRSAATTRPDVGGAERSLAEADNELGRAVSNGADGAELCRAYQDFTAAHAKVIARVAEWPPAAAPLADDYAYDLPTRSLNDNGAVAAGLEADQRRFVQNQWLVWRNTNLRKYIDWRLQEGTP
jgi:ADP-heptose:LPS heptosyltransferase